MYFIEGFYLYTKVESSGRGVLASSKESQVQFVLYQCVPEGCFRGERKGRLFVAAIGEDNLKLILRFSIIVTLS